MRRFRCYLVLAAHALTASTLTAQTDPVRLSGSLQLSTELYSAAGTQARRPEKMYRAIFRPTLTLFDQISLPFEFYYSSVDRGYRQPFNQFGASPRLFGWLTLHGGYYSARLSELTFGDARILGAGAELTPGKFRMMALYGRMQQAVGPDTLRGVPGAYERRVVAGKIGFGSEDGFSIDLNVMRAFDDSGSIQSPASGIAPAENLVVSIATGFPLSSTLRIRAEGALAGYSNDVRSAPLDDVPDWVSHFFTPRRSSQVDGAANISLQFTPTEEFSIGLDTRWVGPGYVSLGYAQLPSDVLDLTLSPAVRFLQGRLSLRSTLGIRTNNLRNNRLAPTRRSISNVIAAYQITDAFGIDAAYSNYGIRSTPRNDTLRIDAISQLVQVTPRLRFSSFGGTSLASVTYNQQEYDDRNTVTGSLNSNNTRTGVAVWSISFPSSLTLTTMATYTSSRSSAVVTDVRVISETVGYALFDNALSLSMTIGYNDVRMPGTSRQVTAGLQAGYSLGKGGIFSMTLMSNRYSPDAALGGADYSESMGSLHYSIQF